MGIGPVSGFRMAFRCLHCLSPCSISSSLCRDTSHDGFTIPVVVVRFVLPSSVLSLLLRSLAFVPSLFCCMYWVLPLLVCTAA